MEGKRRTRRNDGYSVWQRKDGLWEARVTVGYNANGNAKRKSFYARTRTEALEEAKKFKAKLDGGGIAPITRDTSLGQWLDQWLEVYIRPRREPRTIKYYNDFIRLHIKPALGKVPLRKLTAIEVQRLMNKRSESGLSASSVRGLRATLRSALSQAWKEGLVEQNVAARVNPPKMEHADPEHLTPEEAQAFLAALQGNPLEQLFRFGLATGLRVGEVTGLRWIDVDFERLTFTVAKQLQRNDGKLALKDLKSKSSRRTLPLVGIALDALQQQRSMHLLESTENPMGLVFLNSEDRPLDQKVVHNHLKSVMRKAGVRVMSYHKLRHTAATLMVASGVDLHQVKQHLGHSQIALTANLYAHGVTEAQRRAAETLDSVLRNGRIGDGPVP